MLPEKTQAQHVKMHHHLVSGRALATQPQIWQKRQTPFWDIPESDVYIFSPDISYTVIFITSCSDYVRRNGIF